MKKIDLRNFLYHGIVDWLNYDNGCIRDDLCLDKLDSILKHRFIYRPCDFKIYGIKHNDLSNPYTYYFTFLACHPESGFAKRFKKDIKDDNGFMVATSYSNLGLLFSPELLDELKICSEAFCDKEIVFEDNISLDKYGVGIYVNPLNINNASYQVIRDLIVKYDYKFNIFSIYDGLEIQALDEEKIRVRKLYIK